VFEQLKDGAAGLADISTPVLDQLNKDENAPAPRGKMSQMAHPLERAAFEPSASAGG
jgi:hypothetical protein